jgi:hypothetical protein
MSAKLNFMVQYLNQTPKKQFVKLEVCNKKVCSMICIWNTCTFAGLFKQSLSVVLPANMAAHW